MTRAVATRGSRSRTSLYASTTTLEVGRAWSVQDDSSRLILRLESVLHVHLDLARDQSH